MEHRARDYPTEDCGEIKLLEREMKNGIELLEFFWYQ